MKRSERLHLGCGTNSPDGWLNVDGSWQVLLARHRWLKRLLVASGILPGRQASIAWGSNVVRLNLRKELPYSDNRFQAIYSSHLLEHLYYEDAQCLLKECFRVLKPGGICRFVVPDLRSLVGRYLAAKERGDRVAGDNFMLGLYVHEPSIRPGLLARYHRMTAFHQHKWMYDSESLQQAFCMAGFCDVKHADYLQSRIANIDEIEDGGRILNGEGVAVEGSKLG